MTGPEKESHTVIGQPKQDSQNRTTRTGQPERDSQNGTARMVQLETEHPKRQTDQDRQSRTGKAWQAEQDRQSGTGSTGQAEQDRQSGTGSTRQAEQDMQTGGGGGRRHAARTHSTVGPESSPARPSGVSQGSFGRVHLLPNQYLVVGGQSYSRPSATINLRKPHLVWLETPKFFPVRLVFLGDASAEAQSWPYNRLQLPPGWAIRSGVHTYCMYFILRSFLYWYMT